MSEDIHQKRQQHKQWKRLQRQWKAEKEANKGTQTLLGLSEKYCIKRG
jgi:hypothetical protein